MEVKTQTKTEIVIHYLELCLWVFGFILFMLKIVIPDVSHFIQDEKVTKKDLIEDVIINIEMISLFLGRLLGKKFPYFVFILFLIALTEILRVIAFTGKNEVEYILMSGLLLVFTIVAHSWYKNKIPFLYKKDI